MSIASISTQKHTYLKYTFTVSALTTLALVALKSARPHTLSWHWPAGLGVATLVLGVAQRQPKDVKEEEYDEQVDREKALENFTSQLKDHNWTLEEFRNQLNQANTSFDNAKTLKEVTDVDPNETLLNLCKLLDFNSLGHPENELFDAYLRYRIHLAYQQAAPNVQQKLEAAKVDATAFQETLAAANEQFRKAETWSAFCAVEYDEQLDELHSKLVKDNKRNLLQSHEEFMRNIHVQQLFGRQGPQHVDCLIAFKKACELDFKGFLEGLLETQKTDQDKVSVFTKFLNWSELDEARLNRLKTSGHWEDLLDCVNRLGMKTNYGKIKTEETE